MIEDQKILKNIKKGVTESFVGAVLIFIFAVVLFKNPENFLSVAITIFGYLAIFLGVLYLFFYFRIPENERIYNKKLMTGILLISFGFVSFFENTLLKDMIPILLGGFLLILNAERVELAIFTKNKTNNLWIIILVLSSLNILASILLMTEPFPNIKTNQYVSILLMIMEGLYCAQNFLILFGIPTKASKKKEDTTLAKKE